MEEGGGAESRLVFMLVVLRGCNEDSLGVEIVRIANDGS